MFPDLVYNPGPLTRYQLRVRRTTDCTTARPDEKVSIGGRTITNLRFGRHVYNKMPKTFDHAKSQKSSNDKRYLNINI